MAVSLFNLLHPVIDKIGMSNNSEIIFFMAKYTLQKTL
jgi:hypothetical protein